MDPISGAELHGNDVEGVLCIKKPWPSMARTVWGTHERFMKTYLDQYKGYYVSFSQKNEAYFFLEPNDDCSSPETAPVETTKDTTGLEDELTTSSTLVAIDFPLPRSKPLLSTTKPSPKQPLSESLTS